MKLVPDAKQAHRWWSVRLAFIGSVFSVLQIIFPGFIALVNPFERPRLYGAVTFVFFVATLAARLVDQKDDSSE